MHVRNTIITAAAALSASAAADFLVITDYPQALQTLSPEQGEVWISSNLPALQSEFLKVVTDASYIAQATSVIPALKEFAATATADIPPAVTAIDQFTIFTTVPAWYTDLPSGVKAFYDDAASRVESFLDERVPSASGRPANGTSALSATPTGNVTLGSGTPSAVSSISPMGEMPPENTGSAGRVEVGLGVGVVAGLARLLVL